MFLKRIHIFFKQLFKCVTFFFNVERGLVDDLSYLFPVVLFEVLVSQCTDDWHSVFVTLDQLLKFHLDLVGLQSSLKLTGNLAILIALLRDFLIVDVHEQRLFVLLSQLFPLKSRIPKQLAIVKLIIAFLNNVELSHTSL